MRGRDVWKPAAAWLAIAVVLERVATLVSVHVGEARGWTLSDLVTAPPRPGAGRVAWDSGLYLEVAQHGYRLGNGLEAGFPGYALAIRAMVALTGVDWATAAVAISALGGLAVAILLWWWLSLVGLTGRTRWVGLLLVLLFPSAFMLYGVAYNESLVLAAVIAALVCVERDRWVLAGAFGACATFTRPNVVGFAIALVVMALLRSGALTWTRRPRRIGRPRWHQGRLQVRHAGVLLAFAGIGSYLLWSWHHAGDALYPLRLQTQQYGHSPLWHPYTWLKFPVWKDVIPHPADWVHEIASFVLLVAAAATVPVVGRRLGGGHGLFVALLVAASWSGTYDFAPAGRYLLPVLPLLVAVWAPWLARRRGLAAGVLATSGLLSATLAAGFAGAFGLNW